MVKSFLNYEEKNFLQEIRLAKGLPQAHALLKKEGLFDKVRKYSKSCYAKKIRSEITKNRLKKVVTYCGSSKTSLIFVFISVLEHI